MSTIKYITLTTKYARGKIIIIYQRTCSAQAIEAGYDSNEFHPAFLDKLWQHSTHKSSHSYLGNERSF